MNRPIRAPVQPLSRMLSRSPAAAAVRPAGHDASILTAAPGRVLEVTGPPGFGLTRIGMASLTAPSRVGTVAVVDVRGWFCPSIAWEAGVDPERLVVVRCPDAVDWAGVVAGLVEGLPAIYAEVPRGITDARLRTLGSLVRARRSALVLRPLHGGIPAGIAHLRVEGTGVTWNGTERGHGRIRHRRLALRVSGKGVGGRSQVIEVEDDGTSALRVVSGLAAASAGRAAG